MDAFLATHPDRMSDAEIIAAPRWPGVMAAARNALRLLPMEPGSS